MFTHRMTTINRLEKFFLLRWARTVWPTSEQLQDLALGQNLHPHSLLLSLTPGALEVADLLQTGSEWAVPPDFLGCLANYCLPGKSGGQTTECWHPHQTLFYSNFLLHLQNICLIHSYYQRQEKFLSNLIIRSKIATLRKLLQGFVFI